MRAPVVVAVLLTAVGLCSSSCHESDVAPQQDGFVAGIAQKDDQLTQEYLRSLWSKSEQQPYVTVTGTIDARRGGTVAGTPEGWPASFVFAVEVPPGAAPLQEEPLLTISIGIPRAGVSAVPVFKLEPDGLQFAKPVKVTLWHPPWLIPATCLRRYCLTRTDDLLDSYRVSDYELACVPAGEVLHSVTFSTKHFSRWPVENGKGP